MGKNLQTSQKEKIRDFLARRGRDTIDIMREFAVLILLVQKADGLYFLFEKRAATIKQPGDVCFPGGRLEAGESVEACALRETYEEIGLRHIEILGKYGTQYELASIAMHAVVGIVPEAELKNLRLSEAEVAEVFTVPVRFFAETEPYIYEQDIVQDTAGFPYEMLGIRSDYKWRVGHKQIAIYRYEDKIIWGLTASFVRHFVAELGLSKF